MLTALLVGLALPLASVDASDSGPSFRFGDSRYQHRWSMHNQHEFTPDGQQDLARWSDMLTINVFPDTHDLDALAASGNLAVENYRSRGTIVKTQQFGGTQAGEMELLVIAVLGNGELLEANFARFKLDQGVGLAIVSGHRIYGANVAAEMDQWLAAEGAKREAALMKWDDIPTLKALLSAADAAQ